MNHDMTFTEYDYQVLKLLAEKEGKSLPDFIRSFFDSGCSAPACRSV